MAAPTSSNEVTARRLASFATSLWAKIKTWFVAKSGDTMTGRLTMEKAINQVLIGTGTAATSSTSGSTTTYYPALWRYNLSIANPTPGDRLVIKTPVDGSDWGTYLSTDNGTTYYPVARHTGTSRLTNQYPAGAYICVVFEEYVSGSSAAGHVNGVFPVAGSTARVSQKIGCWRVINDYDSGNTVSAIRTENGRFRTGSTGCNPYALVCLDKNGTFSMLTSSGSGTGTSKTINTSGKFKLDAVILWYNADNTTAANTIVSSTYATYNIYHAVDTRYSHNHTTTFTTNAPLYIECTIDEDGFWSPTTTCITQTLTSGKYYIFLGMTYSTEYLLSLMADHPLYYYDGTNLTQVPRLAKADRTKLDGIASGATKVESSSTNGKIKINGTDTTVYTHPAQTAYTAKGSATKVPKITTDSTGHVTSVEEVTISGVTPASHTHGNITNGGALQTNDVTIASGDKLVVTDSSDSNKVARTSVSFDGSTTTTALTPKGTFEAFFKSNTGTTTLQSGTAVKVGTQNGADVKLQLPTIPAAANNGALKIGLNGGTATSKFTANQSGDSTLTFASGTAVGTIKVDGTDVAVTGAQTGLVDFYDITITSSTNTVSAETYAAIAASITAGRMVFLRNGGNPLYRYLDTTSDKLWFYSPFEELAINTSVNNDGTHTFTVESKADASLSGVSENSIQNKAVKAALDGKADASVVSTLSSNVSTLSSDVAAHTTLFHSEVLDVTDSITRFLKISFSGRVGRCIALVIISSGADSTSSAFRLSWDYINSTNGITNLGKEIFSCSDLSKPPLVYKDNNNFYIGIYTSQNRGATISVMMTSEDPSKVSFGTVTRAVATASDKTAVPLTWHAVMSDTVNELVMGYVGTSSKTLYII